MEVAAVKSHRDITLPVPGVPQCPLSGEVTEGIHPLIKESLDEGDPIQHKDIVTRLLTAIQSPAAVAVIKCKAHTNADDLISRGSCRSCCPGYTSSTTLYGNFGTSDWPHNSHCLTEIHPHSCNGGTPGEPHAPLRGFGWWMVSHSPQHLISFSLFLEPWALQLCNVSTGGMVRSVNQCWWAPGFISRHQMHLFK